MRSRRRCVGIGIMNRLLTVPLIVALLLGACSSDSSTQLSGAQPSDSSTQLSEEAAVSEYAALLCGSDTVHTLGDTRAEHETMSPVTPPAGLREMHHTYLAFLEELLRAAEERGLAADDVDVDSVSLTPRLRMAAGPMKRAQRALPDWVKDELISAGCDRSEYYPVREYAALLCDAATRGDTLGDTRAKHETMSYVRTPVELREFHRYHMKLREQWLRYADERGLADDEEISSITLTLEESDRLIEIGDHMKRAQRALPDWVKDELISAGCNRSAYYPDDDSG